MGSVGIAPGALGPSHAALRVQPRVPDHHTFHSARRPYKRFLAQTRVFYAPKSLGAFRGKKPRVLYGLMGFLGISTGSTCSRACSKNKPHITRFQKTNPTTNPKILHPGAPGPAHAAVRVQPSPRPPYMRFYGHKKRGFVPGRPP
jgi:hypothetical protein